MLEIFVTRYKEIHDGTIGEVKVVFNGELVMECFSLEPAGPDTIESNKDRRIPQGEYRLSRWVSKKYIQSLLVHNEVVPKERAILIHNGNTPNHTLGCILLGYTTDNKSGVYNSRKCISDLMKYVVDGEEKRLIIENKIFKIKESLS